MNDVKTIAEYIVNKFYISYRKLLVTLYFVQAEHLVKTGRPCFSDIIRAEPDGISIDAIADIYNIFDEGIIPHNRNYIQPKIDNTSIIDSAVKHCQNKSHKQLIKLIINREPWKTAYNSPLKEITPGMMLLVYSDKK